MYNGVFTFEFDCREVLKMKFQIPKKSIVDTMDRMFEVATKGIRADFKLASRVKIEVKGSSVLFSATNGHLNAIMEVEAQSVESEGSAIVDAGVGREILRTLGGRDSDDHIIEVEEKDQSLRLKDVNTTGRAKTAKLSTLSQDQPFAIKVKKGSSYTLPTSEVSSSLFATWKYRHPEQYEPKYQTMCIHFLEKETRYVCGDGMRFAVLSRKNASDLNVNDKDAGDKWILPADQAAIIANAISFGDTNVTLTFPDAKQCFVEVPDAGLTLHLKGIPEIDYPKYDNHAYRFDAAKVVIDVARSELLDALALVKSVRDKDAEKQENAFHCFDFHASDGAICLEVPKGKYQCKVECDAEIYKVSEDSFDSCYSWLFLNELAAASGHEYIRFFANSPEGIMLAQPMDLVAKDGDKTETDDRVDADCPAMVENSNEPDIIFFFSAAVEEEDEE